jgi:hypothetical protein
MAVVSLDTLLSHNKNKKKSYEVVYLDGTSMWYLDNHAVNQVTHRVDGPAVIWYDGKLSWYLDNIHYDTFSKWLAANNYISDQEKVMLTLLWA